MLNRMLQTMQTAAAADVAPAAASVCRPEPRPDAVTAAEYLPIPGFGITRVAGVGTTGLGSIIGSAWSAIATRKPMTVHTFHDRWPLCST